MVEGQAEPSVGELLGALARDTGVLMRQELQLVSTEMTLKARVFARNTGLIAFGGALALAGGLALLAAAIAALHLVLPLWLSALLVGVAVTGIGYAFISKGLAALKAIDAVPTKTLHTLSADVAWAKEQVR
jgi:drug/metabolite transporter (DMT)-like permease